MTNEICYWYFCFVPISADSPVKIFSFAEFIAAVALFSVVYMVTDLRFKFRIAIAPGALHRKTFFLIAIIGLQTLLTEIWIAERWWVPETIWLTKAIWQGFFGLLFLTTFLVWMYYAFIGPSIFNRRNANRYANELRKYILRGVEEELRIIANELVRSASALVQYSRCLSTPFESVKEKTKETKIKVKAEDYAYEILFLIANRRFCQQILMASPETALVIFETMASINKFNIPISQFARNISSEAIVQTGSFLYEEDDGYTSGLLGYLKPVSRAIYGNYMLVETLAKDNFPSPLDIDFEERSRWDAKQWEGYCRATLITLKDCLEKGCGSQHSFALYRAIDNIKKSYADLYKLNEIPEAFNTEIYKKLDIAVNFARMAVDLIDNQNKPPQSCYEVRKGKIPKNIYDYLALLFFDMCHMASNIKSPPDTCWMIHYNIWNKFFSGIYKGTAWKIVRKKIRRLLYDKIIELTHMPNYREAGILLGYCLNVISFNIGSIHNRDAYILAKPVFAWARKYYLSLRQKNPDVAGFVLFGRVSFDEIGNRLVQTGLDKEAPKLYLQLEPPQLHGS